MTDTFMDGIHGQCCSRANTNFVKHMVNMHLDRRFTDEEFGGDLSIGEPSTDQIVDLSLSDRQR